MGQDEYKQRARSCWEDAPLDLVKAHKAQKTEDLGWGCANQTPQTECLR